MALGVFLVQLLSKHEVTQSSVQIVQDNAKSSATSRSNSVSTSPVNSKPCRWAGDSLLSRRDSDSCLARGGMQTMYSSSSSSSSSSKGMKVSSSDPSLLMAPQRFKSPRKSTKVLNLASANAAWDLAPPLPEDEVVHFHQEPAALVSSILSLSSSSSQPMKSYQQQQQQQQQQTIPINSRSSSSSTMTKKSKLKASTSDPNILLMPQRFVSPRTPKKQTINTEGLYNAAWNLPLPEDEVVDEFHQEQPLRQEQQATGPSLLGPLPESSCRMDFFKKPEQQQKQTIGGLKASASDPTILMMPKRHLSPGQHHQAQKLGSDNNARWNLPQLPIEAITEEEDERVQRNSFSKNPLLSSKVTAELDTLMTFFNDKVVLPSSSQQQQQQQQKPRIPLPTVPRLSFEHNDPTSIKTTSTRSSLSRSSNNNNNNTTKSSSSSSARRVSGSSASLRNALGSLAPSLDVKMNTTKLSSSSTLKPKKKKLSSNNLTSLSSNSKLRRGAKKF